MATLQRLTELGAQSPEIAPSVSGRGSRRSFITKTAVFGLVTATTLFKADSADAAAYYCCNLAYTNYCGYPYCRQNGEYIWTCTSGTRTCTCCEYYARSCSDAKCCVGTSCTCFGSC